MKTLISILCIMCIMMLAVPVTAVEDDVYRYPVQPGTQAWWDLETTSARVEALQIPDDVLSAMSTKTLVQACLDYPFLMEVFIVGGSNPQRTMDWTISRFNGLGELLKRKDAGVELVKAYQGAQPKNIPAHWTLTQKGKQSLRLSGVEWLLAQPRVLKGLNKDRALLKKADAFLKEKKNNPEIFGYTTQLTTALLMGRLMQKETSTNRVFNQKVSEQSELQEFLATGATQYAPVIIGEISGEAEQVLLQVQ